MTTIAELIDLYLTDVAARCSPATVQHYRKRLAALKRSLGNTLLPELNPDDVVTHLEREAVWQTGPKAGQMKAPDTVRANTIAWEQFHRWLLETKRVTTPITSKLKKPGGRQRELLPTKEETRLLLEKSGRDFRAVYLALRLTGARPGELCGATIPMFDRMTQEIVIEQHKTAKKTGKPRRIAVGHESLVRILAEAIGNRTEGHIFLRANGKPWTTDTLSSEYRSARKAAGLRPGLVLYLSRHEHATALYEATGDIKSVADALGHSGIATSMRYTRASAKRMKKNQQLFDDSLE